LIEYEEKMKLHYKYDKYNKSAENIINLISDITDEKYKDTVKRL